MVVGKLAIVVTHGCEGVVIARILIHASESVERAAVVVIGGVGIVVVGAQIGASSHFQCVAHPVLVDVREACSIAVVVRFSQRARAVFFRGMLVVVACILVGATIHFQRVAHSVLIDICEAVAFTIQVCLIRVGARTVVHQRPSHEVACVGV